MCGQLPLYWHHLYISSEIGQQIIISWSYSCLCSWSLLMVPKNRFQHLLPGVTGWYSSFSSDIFKSTSVIPSQCMLLKSVCFRWNIIILGARCKNLAVTPNSQESETILGTQLNFVGAPWHVSARSWQVWSGLWHYCPASGQNHHHDSTPCHAISLRRIQLI